MCWEQLLHFGVRVSDISYMCLQTRGWCSCAWIVVSRFRIDATKWSLGNSRKFFLSHENWRRLLWLIRIFHHYIAAASQFDGEQQCTPRLCGLGQRQCILAAGQVPENGGGQTKSHIPEGPRLTVGRQDCAGLWLTDVGLLWQELLFWNWLQRTALQTAIIFPV